jgi:hypothetical protein
VARSIATATLTLLLIGLLEVGAASSATAAPGKGGSYEGEGTNVGDKALDQVAIKFKVNRKATKVKRWVVRMNVVCATFPASVEFVTQPMPTMKIKDSGRFKNTFRKRIDGVKATITVAGKLSGRRVRQGTLSYRVGACGRGDGSEPIRWKAKRV